MGDDSTNLHSTNSSSGRPHHVSPQLLEDVVGEQGVGSWHHTTKRCLDFAQAQLLLSQGGHGSAQGIMLQATVNSIAINCIGPRRALEVHLPSWRHLASPRPAGLGLQRALCSCPTPTMTPDIAFLSLPVRRMYYVQLMFTSSHLPVPKTTSMLRRCPLQAGCSRLLLTPRSATCPSHA